MYMDSIWTELEEILVKKKAKMKHNTLNEKFYYETPAIVKRRYNGGPSSR